MALFHCPNAYLHVGRDHISEFKLERFYEILKMVEIGLKKIFKKYKIVGLFPPGGDEEEFRKKTEKITPRITTQKTP